VILGGPLILGLRLRQLLPGIRTALLSIKSSSASMFIFI